MMAKKLIKRFIHFRVWESKPNLTQYTNIKNLHWIRLYLHAKIRSKYLRQFYSYFTRFHNIISSTILFCHFWSVLPLEKAVDIAYLRKTDIRPLYCQQVITAYRGTNFLLCCKAIVQWPHQTQAIWYINMLDWWEHTKWWTPRYLNDEVSFT